MFILKSILDRSSIVLSENSGQQSKQLDQQKFLQNRILGVPLLYLFNTFRGIKLLKGYTVFNLDFVFSRKSKSSSPLLDSPIIF